MQLIVLVVISRYVYGDTFAHNTVFRHARYQNWDMVLCQLELSAYETGDYVIARAKASGKTTPRLSGATLP